MTHVPDTHLRSRTIRVATMEKTPSLKAVSRLVIYHDEVYL